jgi:hypothetical protein
VDGLLGLKAFSGVDGHALHLHFSLPTLSSHLSQTLDLCLVESDLSLDWVFDDWLTDEGVVDAASHDRSLLVGSAHLNWLNWS